MTVKQYPYLGNYDGIGTVDFFHKNHIDAFNHAIANDYLTDNENDSNYAGNYMYMHSETIKEQYHPESTVQIDYFKNIDTREYIKVYN